ncbi:DUF4184 family protein [Streptomyces sp. H10-C2]|uniref:DUF4184 family protein n=1 Tax=unclassified Streptomyces TaxID=2593676 RepID=UPI0024BAE09E|nr:MULTISPECIES: DUF4184 family protein [unclassified Streptomyces]MDJ0344476.1 DUF4184 family protein [Streptomyces sp. PH10-H1]MDJ0369650.1 DUF4184 family protein [Streptomyces sp. H10-C2]
MPFTLSHAAAVLPGLRRDGSARGPLVAAALVAGSFAPDMPYFAASVASGVFRYGTVTHSAAGALTVDPLIAAGLVGGWVVVRDPLLTLLPERWQGRAGALFGGRPRPWPPSAVGWFWVSATVGAVTHVGWDIFTHTGRWGVRTVPVLNTVVHGQQLYQWLQYGSSAAALVVLAAFTVRALRAVPQGPPPARLPRLTVRRRAAGAVLLGGCATAGLAVRCASEYAVKAPQSLGEVVPTAAFGAGAGLAGGALLYAAAARLRLRRRRRRQCAADSQSLPTPTETSSGARNG